MIAIIAATNLEAAYLTDSISKREDFLIQKKSFHTGLLNGFPAVVCICGVGKSNAAHGAALLIEKFRPSQVYIVGVAGAYPSSGLSIGDIAAADKEIYGDEGLMLDNGFHTLDEMFGANSGVAGSEFRIQNEFVMHIPGDILNNPRIKKGGFVTVSTCTGTLSMGKEIEKTFSFSGKVLCENMEGAAIAHICALSDIIAVEIRGISNIIEDRKLKPLDKNDIAAAANNVQRFFLDRLVQGHDIVPCDN